jgi:probable rRNA maturation factor
MKKIRFHFAYPCTLSHRNKLRAFLIEKSSKYSTQTLDIDYIFVSDEFLLDINRKHLSHDYYTDIITFNNSNKHDLLSAEIYISVQRVRENAIYYNVSFSHELLRVIFHGMLHLLGYDDTTKEAKGHMTEMENLWLSSFSEFKS